MRSAPLRARPRLVVLSAPTKAEQTAENEALAAAAAAGIHRLPITTPFKVGDINTYLVEGDPLTLVDCGPNSGTGLDELELGLAALGYAFSDLDLIVVTHQHQDHFGLASAIARRSEADVACLDLLAPVLRGWEQHSRADDRYAVELMARHGVDASATTALESIGDVIRGYAAPSRVDRELRDGQQLQMGAREFDILYRPGHSPSDTIFFDPDSQITLCGDHLLSKISSNAIICRPLHRDWDGRRPKPLLEYRSSMLATRALDIEIALGGHGGPVIDHRALIDKRVKGQDRRASKLLDLLADGPLSGHALANAMFGEIAVTQAYLSLSEILGHLDLLIADGLIEEDDSGETIVFAQVP